jgi:hypothetical protein
MSAKKSAGERAVPTGISLPGNLVVRAKAYAAASGYGGLSGLTRHLLTTYLATAADSVQQASNKAKRNGNKEVKRGIKKMRRGNK